MSTKHTPGPWEIIEFNDSLELWNSEVRPEFPIAIVDRHGNYKANARLIHAACISYDKHCGDNAVECAEGDLLGEALDALRTTTASLHCCVAELGNKMDEEQVIYRGEVMYNARAVLAKARRDHESPTP